MVSFLLWSLGAVGIFLWNHYRVPYIGIRFTEKVIGIPISGGWLCVAVALYCLLRFFVRRAKKDRE